MKMLTIFLATYGVVFAAEIVGDKLLYMTGVLAARYSTAPIMIGITFAFMIKMAVAVAVGEVISRLPPLFVAGLTATTFIGVAIAVWRKDDRRAAQKQVSASTAAMVSFAAIFFSEWGDVGQITAAAMSAKYHVPLPVWGGAVCAMVTKGLLAASIGAGVRGWIQEHVPPRVVRYAGVSALAVLGILSVIETLIEGRGVAS
jgi:putative Ca2+/H+ antiporter (TMEM165/GDT1 family)